MSWKKFDNTSDTSDYILEGYGEEEEDYGPPREVLETMTNYNPNSSDREELVDPWWREEDVSRFDDLINGSKINPRVRLMQQTALGLRAHASEFEQLYVSERAIVREVTGQLEEERGRVAIMDNENQELYDHAYALATSNVQLALYRDNLLISNNMLRDASRKKLIHGWVLSVLLFLVIMYLIIRLIN